MWIESDEGVRYAFRFKGKQLFTIINDLDNENICLSQFYNFLSIYHSVDHDPLGNVNMWHTNETDITCMYVLLRLEYDRKFANVFNMFIRNTGSCLIMVTNQRTIFSKQIFKQVKPYSICRQMQAVATFQVREIATATV